MTILAPILAGALLFAQDAANPTPGAPPAPPASSAAATARAVDAIAPLPAAAPVAPSAPHAPPPPVPTRAAIETQAKACGVKPSQLSWAKGDDGSEGALIAPFGPRAAKPRNAACLINWAVANHAPVDMAAVPPFEPKLPDAKPAAPKPDDVKDKSDK